MNTIAILNPKGGTGKSTLSVNLGRALALDGYSTLVVDSDPQATVMNWSRRRDDTGRPDVTYMEAKDVAGGQLERTGQPYDFVVIDGAAKIEDGRLFARLVAACDVVLIPVQPSPADLWAVGDLVDVVQARREATGRPLAAFIVSRQVVGSNLAGAAAEALAAYELPIFEGRTSQRVAFAETMIAGQTVFDSADRKAGEEIESIKNELLSLLT